LRRPRGKRSLRRGRRKKTSRRRNRSAYKSNLHPEENTHYKKFVISRSEGIPKHNCVTLPFLPDKVSGLEIKKSRRWAFGQSIPAVYDFPYITNSVRFSGSNVIRCFCHPEQFLSTMIATISSRITKHIIKHNPKRMHIKFRGLIVRFSFVYLISRSQWLLDRILVLMKNIQKNQNSIMFLIVKFLSCMDDYNRFVYSQVIHQTNWLLYRAVRPRDKSNVGGPSKLWSLPGGLGYFSSLGQKYQRARAYIQAASDACSMCGPDYRKPNKQSWLAPGAICKATGLFLPRRNA